MAKGHCKHSGIISVAEDRTRYPLLGTALDCASVCLISGLGQGGVGSVYLAEECPAPRNNTRTKTATTMAKLIAVKVVDIRKGDPAFLPYLKKEYTLHTKALPHPNIVQIYSFYQTPENTLTLFEYVKDGDFFDMLEKHGEILSRNNALLKIIYLQVLDAVAHIHSKGIYHCDIKPENFLCKRDGGTIRVLLTDFGCSVNKPIIYNYEGLYDGTSFYWPPECLPEAMSVCTLPAATDIWSLGIFLFNMCSGSLMPWTEASYKYNADYRCFEKDPARFFQSFGLSSDVQGYLRMTWDNNLWERDKTSVVSLREKIEAIDIFTTYADAQSVLQRGHRQHPLLDVKAWQRGRCIDKTTQQRGKKFTKAQLRQWISGWRFKRPRYSLFQFFEFN